MVPDLYAILGVRPTATAAEIKKAYRAGVKRTHPDATRAADDAEFKAINAAYGVLSDPVQRASYDRRLAAEARAAEEKRRQEARAAEEQREREARAAAPTDEPAASGGAAVALGVLGLAALALAAAANSNSWDSDAQRYRGANGRFRRSRWD